MRKKTEGKRKKGESKERKEEEIKEMHTPPAR
jgi:hypothetical protein